MTLFVSLNEDGSIDSIKDVNFDGLVEAPDDITLDHQLIEGEWVLPAEIAQHKLEQQRQQALGAISTFAADLTDDLTGPVPLNEKLSWDAKESAARAHIDGQATSTQTVLLQDEADETGEDVLDLANKIIKRATKYRSVVAKVAGLRRATSKLIEAENDPAKFDAILVSAKGRAEQLAASLLVEE